MALTRMKYTPETGLKDKEKFPATPVSEDAAREQFQRLFDQVKTQVNALMAALESVEALKSGAQQIGCAPIDGVTGTTVQEMLKSIKEKIVFEKINGGSLPNDCVNENNIINNAVTANKILAGAVGTLQLADDAVTSAKLCDKAVTTSQLGEISRLLLDVDADEDTNVSDKDRIEFKNSEVKLSISGCQSVQLAPIKIDIKESAPDGIFPAGTLYVQYVNAEQ